MGAQCDDKRGESDWKIKDSTLTFANDFLFLHYIHYFYCL